jgi:hypothetical protein
MSDSKDVLFAYSIGVHKDGTITTHFIPAAEDIERTANRYDVYVTSKELIADIENQLLADRVARAVAAQLAPKDEGKELREGLINALRDRGIDPLQP